MSGLSPKQIAERENRRQRIMASRMASEGSFTVSDSAHISSKSNRNRHTGRINAAKRHILNHGKTARSKDGRIYRYAFFDNGGPTLVRDFDAEHLEALNVTLTRSAA